MPSTLKTANKLRAGTGQPRRSATGITYYYNGNILTMNPSSPRSSHMVVQNNRIWHCSDDAAVLGLNYRDPAFAETRRQLAADIEFVDLHGRTILPGLVDSHVHFLWWAQNLIIADLSPARCEEDALDILKRHSRTSRPAEWIRGFGWSHNTWPGSRLPSRESLDKLFPNNPVHLSSRCGHLGWVNSAALHAADINDATRDPFGGEIERKNGSATGILKETAIALVLDRIGDPTEEQRLQALLAGQAIAHGMGITGMQTPEDLSTWNFLQKANSERHLTMRISFWIPVAALDHLVELQVRNGLGDDRLSIGAVKLFSDGSLGGRTALMYDCYEGEPDNFGICVAGREDIRQATLKANRAGLPMAIHAIGDKAVDNVLAAYEAAAEELGFSGAAGSSPPVRNRIEHLQVFHPKDLDRIKKLRPVASMQPVHLCADREPAEKFWGKRADYAYACRTLREAGCTLAFGSDAPVEPINPFYGLYAATCRRDLEGKSSTAWNSRESIDLQAALEGYTINSAVAAGQTHKHGTLSAGKYADFIVLEEDPFSLTPEALRDTAPVATFSAGEQVHATEAWLNR